MGTEQVDPGITLLENAAFVNSFMRLDQPMQVNHKYTGLEHPNVPYYCVLPCLVSGNFTLMHG
jgi:hypothetical protein